MEHKDFIYEFFWLFSRFEYSLKMTGFHNGNGNAKADWRRFAAAIESYYDKSSSASLAESVAYILENPPNKQVVNNGVHQWSNTPPDSNSEIDLLLQYVCRVRNNLFHGGKYKGKALENPDRSERLITSCNKILRYCLELAPDVRKAFNGNASKETTTEESK